MVKHKFWGDRPTLLQQHDQYWRFQYTINSNIYVLLKQGHQISARTSLDGNTHTLTLAFTRLSNHLMTCPLAHTHTGSYYIIILPGHTHLLCMLWSQLWTHWEVHLLRLFINRSTHPCPLHRHTQPYTFIPGVTAAAQYGLHPLKTHKPFCAATAPQAIHSYTHIHNSYTHTQFGLQHWWILPHTHTHFIFIFHQSIFIFLRNETIREIITNLN